MTNKCQNKNGSRLIYIRILKQLCKDIIHADIKKTDSGDLLILAARKQRFLRHN